MKRLLTAIVLSSVWLCATGNAYGQEMTERYIPIGQSPGLSGVRTDIGEVRAFDDTTRRLELVVDGRVRRLAVADETWIWLDRSKQQLTNLVGTASDLQPGRRVEVNYEDPAAREVADWIKIEVAQ